MSQPGIPESAGTSQSKDSNESNESFADVLAQYEKSHARKPESGGKQIEATVISVSGDLVFLLISA